MHSPVPWAQKRLKLVLQASIDGRELSTQSQRQKAHPMEEKADFWEQAQAKAKSHLINPPPVGVCVRV